MRTHQLWDRRRALEKANLSPGKVPFPNLDPPGRQLTGPAIGTLRAPLKRDMHVNVDIDVDIDRHFGCLKGGSKVNSGTAEWYRSISSTDSENSEMASPGLSAMDLVPGRCILCVVWVRC